MGPIAMNAPCDVLPSRPNETEHLDQASVGTYAAEQQSSIDNHGINAIQSKELVDLAINFLSTSSNETLFGVFVFLVGATYIFLGRFGLLLIGVASGIVLHASWEGMSTHPIGGELNCRFPSRRREIALDIAHRLLDWPERNLARIELKHDDSEKLSQDASEIELDYSSFRPETAAALRSLTDAVIKNYVNYWYEPILPSETTFPLSCRRILTSFITSISTHLSRKRTADTFLEFLTNSSSMVIVFLNELSTAFETAGSPMMSEQAIQRYLDMFPESSLANVLAGQQQRKKLNLIADDILSRFLEPKAYALHPLRDFLREILAGVVLESTISSLSRPEFINGWIIHLFNEGNSEIMSAIDAGVEGARNQGVTAAKDSETLNAPLSTPANGKKSSSEHPSGLVQGDCVAIDKATEEAMVEAKRLSAMIAAQDLQHQNAGQSGDDKSCSSSNDENSTLRSSHWDERTDDHATTQLGSETANAKSVENIHQPISKQALELKPAKRPSSPSSVLSMSCPSSEQPPEKDLHTTLTLHRASISVDDGSEPGDKGLLRSKPTTSYLLQIEPASARCTGWMIFRNYTDFESLHETLGTISRLNRVQMFTDAHPFLPAWKGQTKQALARNLERYLLDALQIELLAESERMKRFLEKDGRLGHESAGTSTKTGFSFPSQVSLENVGKGVLGVLTNAPKGVSDGSRAVFGGVTGVFGVTSVKKTSSNLISNSHPQNDNTNVNQQSIESYPRRSGDAGYPRRHRASLELNHKLDDTQLPSRYQRHSSPLFETASGGVAENGAEPFQGVLLGCPTGSTSQAKMEQCTSSILDSRDCGLSEPSVSSEEPRAADAHTRLEGRTITVARNGSESRGRPITQEETRIAVELIFAVINELYTLSSAWNIRRTLLNAAKSYILRPGNPNLETIRGLLQESMIEANTSDEALGLYITKLRENILPTEAESTSWPSAPNDAEKDRLRETARKALVQRGLPQALTGVMGAAASREALEKVFDSLQVPIIARGLVFSFLLQALRSVIL